LPKEFAIDELDLKTTNEQKELQELDKIIKKEKNATNQFTNQKTLYNLKGSPKK
jgi:hypothetical protein